MIVKILSKENKMKLYYCLLFFVTFDLWAMPRSVEFKNKTLIKQGQAKVEVFFFDVYEIAFYKSSDKKLELLRLKYLRDIDKNASIKGWNKSFDDLKGKSKAKKWILGLTPDMKKGQVFSLYKEASSKTYIYKESDLLGESSDREVYELVHYPWIGKNPFDKGIKNSLLGK